MSLLPTVSPDDLVIDSLVDRWLPGAQLSTRQWWELRRSVIRVGGALGVADELARRPFEHGTAAYQGEVIGAAVDAMTRQMLEIDAFDPGPFAYVATGAAATVAGFLPATLVDAIDVNAASVDELASLPGLGPVSARRIVARRDARGPYVEMDDVRRAAGVASATFERTSPRLTIGDAAPTPAETAATAVAREHGLAGFLQLWSTDGVERHGLEAETPVEAMLELLAAFAAALRVSPSVPRLWAPSRARLRRGSRALRADAELAATGATDARVGPIFSAGYLPQLLSLIDAAEDHFLASMFFFTVGAIDDEGDPGDRIVEALENARGRGVDIRLILDDDVAGDRHGARLVNESTITVLEDKGIPFRRDHLEVTSHAKVVVADGRHVIVGSHNWTASSFFQYQETSCYVDSASLGEQVRRVLDRRWQLLAPAAERIVPVELLELLPRDTRVAVVDQDLADGADFVEATRLKNDRLALQVPLGIPEDQILRARKVVRLMQEFRISETTAVALVMRGLDSPTEVERASRARLGAALGDLDDLPEPFGLRAVLPGFVEWLAGQER